MFLIKKILTSLILPPVGPVIGILVGALLARKRVKLGRAGRIVVALNIFLLLALSVPVVSNRLAQSLEVFPAVEDVALTRAQAIVILGGGTYYGAPEYGGDTVSSPTLVRLRYGALLARKTGLPLLVTAGSPYQGHPEADSMRDVLVREWGLPVRWCENRSRDTRENAAFSAEMLKAAGVSRIALVSHAGHLLRAVTAFKAQGLEVIAAPTAFSTVPHSWLESLLPSAHALAQSAQSLHEWLGRWAGQ